MELFFRILLLCCVCTGGMASPRLGDVSSIKVFDYEQCIPDCNPGTLMATAISEGKKALIYSLVEEGIDVNRRLEGGTTALTTAVKSGRVESVRALLDLGAISSLEDDNRSTPFLEALLSGKEDVVEAFVESRQARLETSLKDNSRYLHRVVEEANMKAVMVLLKLLGEQKEGLDARNDKRETPLALAVRMNDVRTANLLISAGSDLLEYTGDGETYLHLAMKHGSHFSARNLVDVGLSPDSRSESGETPIATAVRRDDVKAAEFLLELGADIAQEGYYGENLLHLAKYHGSVECVEFLVSKGLKDKPTDNGDADSHTELNVEEDVEYIF